VGIAMGAAGSHAALETADVVLMADDLSKLPGTVHLGRQTRGIITANVAFAVLVKLVFLGLAAAGVATLWMAVFADVGATMIVILNGMRLLRAKL
jgi:Zn2+/Cd2+-exporting ATPase